MCGRMWSFVISFVRVVLWIWFHRSQLHFAVLPRQSVVGEMLQGQRL